MVIQTPGSFVWAGSLAARLGIEGWSTWGVYLVTGFLQGSLLVMGIYFEVQARKTGIHLESEVRFIDPSAWRISSVIDTYSYIDANQIPGR